jgi:hypothetical protein
VIFSVCFSGGSKTWPTTAGPARFLRANEPHLVPVKLDESRRDVLLAALKKAAV